VTIMKFWSEHTALHLGLMAGLFLAGIAAVLFGLSLGGKFLGLVIMLGGLGLLLTVLWLYNRPFTDVKNKL